MNCIIVDDEPLARNLLTEYVDKTPFLHLLHSCSSAMEALEVLRKHSVDLIFLDIQMPEITGLAFLKILQKRPMVILTTAYSEYALQGYELDVVDYLLKPITLERFLKAVDKAAQRTQNAQASPVMQQEKISADFSQSYIFIKDGTKLVKVKLDDILYVEGLKDYVTVHTRIQKIVSLQRLKTLEIQLPADKFIRIHHSFIVALEGIDSIHKEKVQIGNTFIPISDSYKKAFREFINKNYIQPG